MDNPLSHGPIRNRDHRPGEGRALAFTRANHDWKRPQKGWSPSTRAKPSWPLPVESTGELKKQELNDFHHQSATLYYIMYIVPTKGGYQNNWVVHKCPHWMSRHCLKPHLQDMWLITNLTRTAWEKNKQTNKQTNKLAATRWDTYFPKDNAKEACVVRSPTNHGPIHSAEGPPHFVDHASLVVN